MYLVTIYYTQHIPTSVVSVPDPASLVTVHSYIPPSELVITVNSKLALLETISPFLLHTNLLLGPPPAKHVKFTDEFKLGKLFLGGIIWTLPKGDTVKAHKIVMMST